MKKFKYAFEGLISAINNKAVRIQIILGLMAIVGGLIIKLDFYEWLAFIICIGLVISLEIVNSCIEELCNLYTNEFNPKIKIIKDCAAAAVLIAAIVSFVICAICVIRRII